MAVWDSGVVPTWQGLLATYVLVFTQAPVEGSYYGDLIVELEMRGQVCTVPYDRAAGVVTSWDLGMADKTAIWFAPRLAT